MICVTGETDGVCLFNRKYSRLVRVCHLVRGRRWPLVASGEPPSTCESSCGTPEGMSFAPLPTRGSGYLLQSETEVNGAAIVQLYAIDVGLTRRQIPRIDVENPLLGRGIPTK